MALIVEGIIEASATSSLAEAELPEDAGFEVIPHRDLAGLVTETASDDVLPSRANLMAHMRILEAIHARTPVLPMRFGVVVPDRDTLVAAYLEPGHDRLRGMLEQLAGHTEMRLRGRYDEESVLRDILESDQRAATLHGREDHASRMELGERVVRGLEARREGHSARVIEALGPLSSDAVATNLAESLDAFAFSFLVSRDNEQRFRQEVERLGEELAPMVTIQVVGPMPPFSFVALEED